MAIYLDYEGMIALKYFNKIKQDTYQLINMQKI